MIQIHTPTTTLSCPTCTLQFPTQTEHKEHYKSDFHRYNLKRKMVKLAPATLEQFRAKKNQTVEGSDQMLEFTCGTCRRRFGSLGTLEQHLRAKGHSRNPMRQQTKPKTSQQPKPAKPPQNNTTCLFCTTQSPTFAQNLRHMQSSHSFFIPQPQYCINQPGLISYLQQKINIGFMCITCENRNAKDFSSGEAVRRHMLARGHTFMKIDEGFEQYLEYYDFSRQFMEILEGQKGRDVPGIEYTTIKVVVRDDKHIKEIEEQKKKQEKQLEGNDQQWEDQQSSQSQSDNDNQQQKQIKQKQGQQDEWQSQQQPENPQQPPITTPKKVKTFHLMRPTQTSTSQLLLPNGKTLGHRKYRHLYRQTIRPVNYWLNRNLKQIGAVGSESYNNSLVMRDKLEQLIRQEHMVSKYRNRQNKRELTIGMANNAQKYFRTRNSL